MQTKDIIYFSIVIFILIGVIYGIIFIMDDRSQCLKNPFIYGASKMQHVECSCTQLISSCPPTFFFNDSSFITKDCVVENHQYSNITIPKLNFINP
jgi:hypothetical protein